MSIAQGQDWLHYRLVEKIGEGGMGVVWKAVDTTLDREVAIKFLPEGFSFEDERLARFEREAKLLASLNNPHIAAIYGLHEARGVRFLVMELVAGEDLAQRLGRGPLPLDEAVDVARQIALGVEAAHDNGVIHRDLKPANVRLTPDGKVKVLDFGLAKTTEPTAASGSAPTDLAMSPTVTSVGTVAGVILGTAGYMSPEQARGKPVDRRADVWAFGCVLYEMLTGRRAFGGETVTDVLAAIVRAEPELDKLPVSTPPGIRRLLQRCLRKDPNERLRDIGDARLEMLEASSGDDAIAIVESDAKTVSHIAAGMLTVAGVVVGLTIGFVVWRGAHDGETARRPARGALRIPVTLAEPSLSPGWGQLALVADGRSLIYGTAGNGPPQLIRVDLDTLQPQPILGGEGARWPSVSPDGAWIAFQSAGKIEKLPVGGGQPVALAETGEGFGASWGDDGWLYFSEHTSGISRVRSDGGRVERLVQPPDDSKNLHFHGPPHALPGGNGFLYVATDQATESTAVHVVTLPELDDTVLVEDAAMPRYSAGYLVYTRDGDLIATRFDPERLRIEGDEIGVLQPAMDSDRSPTNWTATWGGTMAYVPGGGEELLALAWVDRDGRQTPIPAPSKEYRHPRLSPDGSRIAVEVHETHNDSNIWVYDLRREVFSRVTRDESFDANPVWLPNGRELIFNSDREGPINLYRMAADGSGEPRRLTAGDANQWPLAVTGDGQSILVDQWNTGRSVDIMIVDSAGEGEPSALIATDLLEGNSALSPDGRWLAYEQGTGERTVYVQPFPGPGERRQVSSGEGYEPVWAHDGQTLYYRVGSTVYAVRVGYEPDLTLGKPELWVETDSAAAANQRNYDVAPDGRFLVLTQGERGGALPQINLVLDWSAEIGTGNGD